MKLFVDDIRLAPQGWHLARTITEAIRILATVPVEVVSLDHDICYLNTDSGRVPEETYEAVARFILLLNRQDLHTGIEVYCHSGNPLAAERYKGILAEFFKGQIKYEEMK